MKRWLALALLPMLLLGLPGCAGSHARELTAAAPSGPSPVSKDMGALRSPLTDFSLRLFAEIRQEQENSLLSPFSVAHALSMAYSGSQADTRAVLTALLGQDEEAWRRELGAYLALDKGSSLKTACSVWLRDDERLSVRPDFLELCRKDYQAQVFASDFAPGAERAINRWVKNQTAGRIDRLIDEIRENDMLFLCSALAFDAEWKSPYTRDDVSQGVFYAPGGEVSVKMMRSSESILLETALGEGFLKPYRDGRYALAAVLPKEDVSLNELIASLAGNGFSELLQTKSESLSVRLPKFSASGSVDLSDSLKAMGASLAFDPDRADFSAMGTYDGQNLAIGRVLHEVRLEVDEKGTRGGAATAVTMLEKASLENPRELTFDRPFFYAVIDREAGIPIFLGTLVHPN